MLSRFKKKPSEFSKNVLILMSGTTIAQAIPIAISPILTRIYTPEDFGVFALYMSVTSILSVVVTGRYELAIMLPKKDEDAKYVLYLSLILTLIISGVTLLFISLFHLQIASILGNDEIAFWLYFTPLTLLALGVYQSFTYWNNRQTRYKTLAMVKAFQSGVTGGTGVAFGFSSLGSAGLIYSAIAGQIVAAGSLVSASGSKESLLFRKIKKVKLIALLKKYSIFPKINLPHSFLNSFSSELPILLLSQFFFAATTGFYSLANRVVLSPASLIAAPYAQVFFQKISQLYREKREIETFFNATLYKLAFFALLPFVIILLFAPQIFSILFGDEWRVAGEYTQVLVPMFYFRFIGSILSSVAIVYERQKRAFFIESINMLLRFLALLIGGAMGEIFIALALFSTVSSMVTIYRIFWYKSLVKEMR